MLTIFISGIGFTIYFLVVVREAKLTEQAIFYEEDYRRNSIKPAKERKLSDYIVNWQGWMKEATFYWYGMAYMLAKISI